MVNQVYNLFAMNTTLLHKVEKSQLRERPEFNVGDEISVHNIIREGEKTRVQIYRGIVLAKKGSGLSATFTVRKISDGIGVEKIFPLHSPNIEKIVINKHGKVRRAKLYYMRDRQGKSAMKINSATETQLGKIAAKEAAIEAEKQAEAKKAAEAEAKAKAEAEAAAAAEANTAETTEAQA